MNSNGENKTNNSEINQNLVNIITITNKKKNKILIAKPTPRISKPKNKVLIAKFEPKMTKTKLISKEFIIMILIF